MNFNTIKIEKDSENFITSIILDRPAQGKEARVNTINNEMLDDLNNILDILYNDSETRVIIIRGANNTFSGGADIRPLTGVSTSGTNFSAWKFKKLVVKGQRTFKRLRDFPIPIIASIEGYALGGGLEMAMNCDLRYASEEAVFGQPEVKAGLICGWGGTQIMVRHIGVGRTMELLLTGDVIFAKKALEIGLINGIFKKEKLEKEVYKIAKKIAINCSPIAVAISKQMVNFGGTVPLDIGLEMESYGSALNASTEDFREGMDAFLKRKAKYQNK